MKHGGGSLIMWDFFFFLEARVWKMVEVKGKYIFNYNQVESTGFGIFLK